MSLLLSSAGETAFGISLNSKGGGPLFVYEKVCPTLPYSRQPHKPHPLALGPTTGFGQYV